MQDLDTTRLITHDTKLVKTTNTSLAANKTGAVAKPSLRSTDVGFPRID